MTKDEAAEELIRWHFQTDDDIQGVFRFIAANEDGSDEPIKLLEVSNATIETGRIDAFGFASTPEIPYPTVIAVLSPGELTRVRDGEIPLPDGWSLDQATYVPRPDIANAA
jgi:hypothetical protein